jgi:hypothetical protein
MELLLPWRQVDWETCDAPAGRHLSTGQNWPQFSLLVLVNAFVGGTVGLERTVVPLIGGDEFHLSSATVVASFIAGFSISKALTNLVSGQMADNWDASGYWCSAGLSEC